MNIVLLVNDSPWGSTLAATALRVAGAMTAAGHHLDAVFFRGDGVYNAAAGTASGSGQVDVASRWSELAKTSGARLMLCQASAQRRLGSAVPEPFELAGLVELADLAIDCDRVVTF